MTDTLGNREWSPPARARLGVRLRAELDAEQDHWFLWVPVAFGSGIAAYFALSIEPPLWMFVIVAALLGLVHGLGRRVGLVSLVTAALLATGLGGLVAKTRNAWVTAPALTRPIGPVEAIGWIELVEPRVERGQRLTIRVLGLGKLAADAVPYRIRVRTLVADASLAAGQAVRLKVNLGPPPVPAAPGDFDFGRLAWFQRLGGIGIAVGAIEPAPDLGPPPWRLRWFAPIERLRQELRARITATLPGEIGEIATALITGERGGISEATNQAFRDSGLFHILSISGLHMVIMAGTVFYLLRLLLALVTPLALRYPIKKWAAAGAIVAAFGYLLISGAAFATVRSYVMITIMFVAVLLDRPALALRNVALAALLILAVFPESLLDAGFQMSFAAVTGLVAAYEWLRRRREARLDDGIEARRGPLARAGRFVGEIVLSTLIASLVVAPFGIYHFHNTQLLALVANVFAIPICNIVVMPAALAVLVSMPLGLQAGPLAVMGWGIEAMASVARVVGAMPGAVAKVPAIPTMAFVLMVLGGLWLLLWSRPWRIAGLVGIALGVLLAPGLARPDVMIGRDGTTVGVRGADGRLQALAIEGSAFELSRWLELDGDERKAADVANGHGFRCDAVGCSAVARGRIIQIATSPAALRDDCGRADVLVLRFADMGRCRTGPAVRIDPAQLARAGAHAIYLHDGVVRIETVAATRGARPWSGPLVAPPATGPADGRAPRGGRLSGIAGWLERFRPSRPEVDDEAWPRGRPASEN